jgi:transposase
MLGVTVGVKVYLACGFTDLRKGMGLAVLVQHVLHQDPFSGAVFAFRGKRGNMVKLLAGTRKACAFISSAWMTGALCGRKQRMAWPI